MTLFGLIIAIIVVGFFWWMIDQIPIDPTFKKIAKGALLFFFIIWLLNFLGVFHGDVLNQKLT